MGRIFFVFGVPLLLSVRKVYLPKWVAVPVIVGFAVGQVAAPTLHFVHVADLPSTKASFFAPALQFAGEHYDPSYRFHVVALDTHWEAYYFPINDYPITRGWFRQEDALHNTIFDSTSFTARQYVAWLQSMGVKYVFLPKAPLDISGPREALLLATTPQFTVVHNGPQWTVYRLAAPQSVAVPMDPGGAIEVLYIDHESVFVDVTRAGSYLIKYTYTPYWRVTDGIGSLTKGPGDFVVLHASEPGFYGMRVQVDLESLGEAMATL